MIDSDQRPPLFPSEEAPPTGNTAQESIFSSLGFLTNPFSDDPANGPFIEASGQSMVLDLLTEWWQEQPGGSLALVTGATGSGKTRLFLEVQRVVASDNTTLLATVADQGAKRSDAQLLKDILIAFAGTPVGRTGLELQSGIRQRFGQIVDAGQRPLLLVDSANFTGSQLEILRSLLTDAPASIVLFGDPDLADRVTRRQSLAALVGFASEIEPFEADEITNLIQQRLAASLANEGDASFLIDDDAWREVNDLVRGNPARAIRLMHAVLLDAVAHNRKQVDAWDIRRAQQAMAAAGSAPAADRAIDRVVQTRFELPGFEEVSAPAERRRRRSSGGAG